MIEKYITNVIFATSHLNFVQKDERGNFLVNGYNVCSAAYYINGSTGAIIWSLGNSNSSFHFFDNNHMKGTGKYGLKYMHHVRFQPLSRIHLPDLLKANISDSGHIAVSLFDNAFSAAQSPPTAAFSSATVVLLDLQHHTARIVERYPHPRGAIAAMFGSLTLLPDGDRFIGWGSARDMSQHTRDGHTIFHAEIGDEDTLVGSLRAFKASWVGRPATQPAVYAYAWGCSWKTAVYVSWNGATEVRSYRVSGANKKKARFVQVAIGDKNFETRLQTDRFVQYVFVEALGQDGLSLERSSVVLARVPPPVEARGCSEWRCPATLSLPQYGCSNQGHGSSDSSSHEVQAVLAQVRR